VAKQFRKAKRKTPGTQERKAQQADEKHEADLAELWDVLAESPEHSSWHVPWRDGRNAAGLCLQIIRAREPADHVTVDLAGMDLARRCLSDEVVYTAELYWQLNEVISELTPARQSLSDYYLVAALRCIQLMICNSHGGGVAYNGLLDALNSTPDRDRLVRAARCKDALGIEPEFDQNTYWDRLRRAFYAAWDRKLYTVAYAVGRKR
jgi:hypothetical protein